MTRRSRRLARRYDVDLRGLDPRQQRRLLRRIGKSTVTFTARLWLK